MTNNFELRKTNNSQTSHDAVCQYLSGTYGTNRFIITVVSDEPDKYKSEYTQVR